MINRAMMVEETEAIIMMFPTWDLVRPRSARMVGIKGASPEPSEEANKEHQPGNMECLHLDTLQREDIQVLKGFGRFF